ncbi:hypothetical protein Tco_0621718 [Tanacetum coccineum]
MRGQWLEVYTTAKIYNFATRQQQTEQPDSIMKGKDTSSQTKDQNDSLMAQLNKKSNENADVLAQIQKKGFAIAALKTSKKTIRQTKGRISSSVLSMKILQSNTRSSLGKQQGFKHRNASYQEAEFLYQSFLYTGTQEIGESSLNAPLIIPMWQIIQPQKSITDDQRSSIITSSWKSNHASSNKTTFATDPEMCISPHGDMFEPKNIKSNADSAWNRSNA